MDVLFYISASVAVITTLLTVTGKNPVHALMNLIVSLLAISVTLYLQGAVFAAVLEVIVYAGAIMVLFLFVLMLLNVKPHVQESQKRSFKQYVAWVVPFMLATVLLGVLIVALRSSEFVLSESSEFFTKDLAVSLFTTYSVVVELASLLLLAGLVGAYHIVKKKNAERGVV